MLEEQASEEGNVPLGKGSIQSPHTQTDQPLSQPGLGGAIPHQQVWAYQKPVLTKAPRAPIG